MTDEFGKAEAAFGASATKDANAAASRAFGPSTPISGVRMPTGIERTATNDVTNGRSMSDALRGTYEQIKAAADETARRYMRFGTGGSANKNATKISDVAREVVDANASAQPATVKSPSIQSVRMSAPPSWARGGSTGAGDQTTADVDGYTVFLGGIDANDNNAVDSAIGNAKRDIAWMNENGYFVED